MTREAGDWHSITFLREFARPRFVEFASRGLIDTRACLYIEYRYSAEARVAITAAQLAHYRAQTGASDGPDDVDLAEIIEGVPATKFTFENWEIAPSLWAYIGEDGSIWQDGSWAQNGGKFGTYLVGIEFLFGGLAELRGKWLVDQGQGKAPANRKLDHGQIRKQAAALRAAQPEISKGSAAASIIAELGDNPKTGRPWDNRGIERIIGSLWKGGQP